MGLIVSRFKKRRSTVDQLRQLQLEIDAIEQLGRGGGQQGGRWLLVRYLLLLSVVGAVVFYVFLPPDLFSRLLYASLLLLPMSLIFLARRLQSFFHARKLRKKQSRLTVLLKEKKSLLDEVQEKETYKVAKRILEEFAPSMLRLSPPKPASSEIVALTANLSNVRRRTAAASPSAPLTAAANPPQTPTLSVRSLLPSGAPAVGSNGGHSDFTTLQRLNQQRQAMMSAHLSPATSATSVPVTPRSPLPRPVLSRERGYLDRVMDVLIGDGPANRYALICSLCHSHNGMALREEFEYLAFRCCYCHGWNPARKQRPSAPRLPNNRAADTSSDTDQSDTSDSDDGASPAVASTDVLLSRPSSSRLALEQQPRSSQLEVPSTDSSESGGDGDGAPGHGAAQSLPPHCALPPRSPPAVGALSVGAATTADPDAAAAPHSPLSRSSAALSQPASLCQPDSLGTPGLTHPSHVTRPAAASGQHATADADVSVDEDKAGDDEGASAANAEMLTDCSDDGGALPQKLPAPTHSDRHSNSNSHSASESHRPVDGETPPDTGGAKQGNLASSQLS